MSITEFLSKFDHTLRPILHRLPPQILVALYSSGRRYFGNLLSEDIPKSEYVFNDLRLSRTLWGIRFRSPLFNAAGMFKYGEGYDLCASLGAGAYLAGTSTATPRKGNSRNGVHQPFCPYPGSFAASNWLGLPNPGHTELAKTLSKTSRILDTPIGVSVAADSNDSDSGVLSGLVDGLRLFERAGVDFIEMNESCPNVHGARSGNAALDSDLLNRLEFVQFHFLKRRKRRVPVIVKLSNDTAEEQVPLVVDALVTLGFDGVNFGNTSTRYQFHRHQIMESERPSFDYFTKTFGGGLSGRLLQSDSRSLAKKACNALTHLQCTDEFHVIRTGGIDSASEITESTEFGISLFQWYTGFFDSYAQHGSNVYARLYTHLSDLLGQPAL